MSRLKVSTCFTRELVAMGRRMRRFVEAAVALDFFGGILEVSDLSVVCGGSILRETGPALGALWLNWERREWGSMVTCNFTIL